MTNVMVVEPVAEPDHQDRQPRDIADGLEEQQQRPQRRVRALAHADQDAERNAERDAPERAHRQPHHAVLQVFRQDALVGERAERLHHLPGSRQEHAREHLQRGHQPPHPDHGNERHDRSNGRPARRQAEIGTPCFEQSCFHARCTMPQRSMVARSIGASTRRSSSSHSTPITIMPSTITSVR